MKAMDEHTVAPYGSWRSPITAEMVSRHSLRLQGTAIDGEFTYWIESRPAEGGRCVLVRSRGRGAEEVSSNRFNVRSAVHEYGGGAYAVSSGAVVFSNLADSRLYRIEPGGRTRPITPVGKLRYGDLQIDARRNRVICILEDHSNEGEVKNSLVAIDLESGGLRTLESGEDFYSSPRIGPKGDRLAWISWNHPLMPWEGTKLWSAPLDEKGSPGKAMLVAGGVEESVLQPEWSPEGELYNVSDSSGWWNLYRWDGHSNEALAAMEADFGRPQWTLGESTYAIFPDGRIICSFARGGVWHLAFLGSNGLDIIECPYTEISQVRAGPFGAAFLGGSPKEATSVVHLGEGGFKMLRRSGEEEIDPGYISRPVAFEFLGSEGRPTYAFYYPPKSRDHLAPEEERPPLLVICHSGPTSAASTTLNLLIQFWTSRGFAAVDVNYGGSTGYGREYRERLKGLWGVVDVEDCERAALHLSNEGFADARRLIIRGGSAGGYTALSLLAFRDSFRAGAIYYGISNLVGIASETHKFESHYNEWLVGPQGSDMCKERSPLYHADRIDCPAIFFQGLEDHVVPPNQTIGIYEAMKARGILVSYLSFPREGHGFRDGKNVKRALEAELYFYGRILGIEPSEQLEVVRIENM
ncbi:MAG: S9 family peptidase [Methanotrichaceae archaeon]|nr:S9 family peptidase [Methanotrichaceae archaeon]